MDFLDELFELMGEPTIDSVLSIAQEAEDITGQVKEEAANATGNNGDKEKGEIDLNTDDILGTKTPEGDNDGSEEDPDNNPGDDNSDPNGDGDELSGDANGDSSSDEQMNDKMEEMSDPFEASRKKKLWLLFKAFHKTLSDSIMLITKYVPNVSDAPTIKALDNIKENLTTGKDTVYRILTDEYRNMTYPEMQKKYVGLNHIYDICTNELETYFDKMKKDK